MCQSRAVTVAPDCFDVAALGEPAQDAIRIALRGKIAVRGTAVPEQRTAAAAAGMIDTHLGLGEARRSGAQANPCPMQMPIVHHTSGLPCPALRRCPLAAERSGPAQPKALRQ